MTERPSGEGGCRLIHKINVGLRQACAGTALVAVLGVSAGASAASHVVALANDGRQPQDGAATLASFVTDSAPSHQERLTALILARSRPQTPAVIARPSSGTTSKHLPRAGAGNRVRTAAAPATSQAPAAPASAGPVVAAPGNSAGYAFGYCTWWVSHKRYIPWHGLAYQWWSMARAYGFAEGSTPRVGAVMVMAAGAAGASASSGHVAYVEAVNPNGSFVISEMNWYGAGGGFGKVDYRTITSMRGILGFIY